ncbi:MAG TPA: hypothetical protein VKY31_08635 [Terriglobia bacterium]|nr:hypothetical protein [Terriglobia bacterium]
MKTGWVLLLGVLVWHLSCETGTAKPNAVRAGSAIVCAPGSNERISLRSTDRLPEASGAVRVECRGGTTEIEVQADSMKPASLFGGDYNTYVLWVVPPRGAAENLGEIALDGDRGTLRASTAFSAFAVLITAEPHYLVTTPSAFVVLKNKSESDAPEVHYSVLEGVYNFERSTLAHSKEAKGKVHTDVRQAFTAVRLAQRAGAPQLAAEEFVQADQALNETIHLWRQHADRNGFAAQARKTVRLAVAAQRLAMDRGVQGTQIGQEGSGGGNDETGRRDQRGRLY